MLGSSTRHRRVHPAGHGEVEVGRAVAPECRVRCVRCGHSALAADGKARDEGLRLGGDVAGGRAHRPCAHIGTELVQRVECTRRLEAARSCGDHRLPCSVLDRRAEAEHYVSSDRPADLHELHVGDRADLPGRRASLQLDRDLDAVTRTPITDTRTRVTGSHTLHRLDLQTAVTGVGRGRLLCLADDHGVETVLGSASGERRERPIGAQPVSIDDERADGAPHPGRLVRLEPRAVGHRRGPVPCAAACERRDDRSAFLDVRCAGQRGVDAPCVAGCGHDRRVVGGQVTRLDRPSCGRHAVAADVARSDVRADWSTSTHHGRHHSRRQQGATLGQARSQPAGRRRARHSDRRVTPREVDEAGQ